MMSLSIIYAKDPDEELTDYLFDLNGCLIIKNAVDHIRFMLTLSPLGFRVLFLIFLLTTLQATAFDGNPTPHDDAHLAIFNRRAKNLKGKDVKPTGDKTSVFKSSFVISEPRLTTLKITHPGTYDLWIHLGRPSTAAGVSVNIKLSLGDRVIKEAVVGKGMGSVGSGGPSGFMPYYDIAMENTKDAVTLAKILGYDVDITQEETESDDDIADLMADEDNPFVSMKRVEKYEKNKPWYWWKAFKVKLKPGTYTLAVSPTKKTTVAARMDTAFLSTSKMLSYPYVGDFSVPRGTYVRFKINALPRNGKVSISGSMGIHSPPWRANPLPFSSTGIKVNREGTFKGSNVPHTKTGFTRWYRLQDIRYVPGGGSANLIFSISDLAQAKGVTQFASYPHQDQVVREFDWHEPDGLRISMNMNVAGARHALVTYRDLERVHYEYALSATSNRLFPLTRGRQAFGNAAGGATGAAQDYMFKVLRLLGFTAVSSTDPGFYRKHYGGDPAGGHYWPPVFMPYDPKKAEAQYDAHYKSFFAKRSGTYKHMRIFQIADEPGEINREAMTAPFWDYVSGKPDGRWVDRSGLSSFHTKKVDYENCVLEGNFQVHGGTAQVMGFRVGTDSAKNPKSFGYWQVGKFSQNRPDNLRSGKKGGSGTVTEKAGAGIGTGAHRFKIIYQGTEAFLYVNDRLMSGIKGLKPKGGFGFYGQKKSIWGLNFRNILAKEKMVASIEGLKNDGLGAEDDDDLEDGIGDIMDDDEDEGMKWAKKKPIKQRIEEDWQIGGGIAGSHEGFRRWLAEQKIAPSLFKKKRMADVNLLTIRGLTRSLEDRKRYYWSRRYSGQLTPQMFGLAGKAIHKYAPNKKMETFVALSGHALYMHGPNMPLDMFELSRQGSGNNMMGGCSDYMSWGGSWWWDTHETVAYTAAFSNSGGRNYNGHRHSFPMMHCATPSAMRSYIQLGNQVKYISYFWYGPSYAGTEYLWSENKWSYHAVSATTNKTAQVDDILSPGEMRPSRVALLYSRASEYWNNAAWVDKRAAFHGLNHEYFRPELVTEEQINHEGALKHYDAIYVLEPNVESAAQAKIATWVKAGGFLFASWRAAMHNAYNEKEDLLQTLAGLKREANKTKTKGLKIEALKGEAKFEAYPVYDAPFKVNWPGSRVRAKYSDGRAAWAEKAVGKGRVVYLGHQPGGHYSRLQQRRGDKSKWNEHVRYTFTASLKEAGVEREVIADRPLIFASPISTDAGTVVVIYNLHPDKQENIRIGIREPEMPLLVQRYEGWDLIDAKPEYKDGRVWVTIPSLAVSGGSATQMILIRRKKAPADPRDEQMRQRVLKDMTSKDPRVLSAALWIAGFRPQWKLGKKLVPFISHRDWRVRRSTAESLGRLKYLPAQVALIAAIQKENDGHVLGDQLIALRKMGSEKTFDQCLAVLKRDSLKVQGQQIALQVLNALTKDSPDLDQKKAIAIAMQFETHPDKRLAHAAKALKKSLKK